ncbi:Ig-like domain-containing protein [Hymenobacter negativus]|uniref:SbsA Ig-like domain-containing protein n=1 Tax=Hymenobacter negativus TaxID=2795026 RepID=A0ABS3QN32_9BACT|nr:Ig-like domain-containing protein [Hymenobacter negativus]MBO2012471.1 hypothetical protein [Hymenobacter negativus]
MKQPYSKNSPATYSRLRTGYVRLLGLLLLLALLPWMAWAQAPTITAVSPVANARSAAPTSPVQVDFGQPLTAGSTTGCGCSRPSGARCASAVPRRPW